MEPFYLWFYPVDIRFGYSLKYQTVLNWIIPNLGSVDHYLRGCSIQKIWGKQCGFPKLHFFGLLAHTHYFKCKKITLMSQDGGLKCAQSCGYKISSFKKSSKFTSLLLTILLMTKLLRFHCPSCTYQAIPYYTIFPS